jgi:glycosyltransferase involved in cell wall biosynthesis
MADVTVVMPAKNGAQTIARALASIRAQSVRPKKVVIVDDGSSDGTADAARDAADDLDVHVIVNDTSRGSGPSRNLAIEVATTRWIAFLDCDDEWLPGHLEQALDVAQGHVLVTAPALDSQGHPRGNVSGKPLRLTPARCFVPDNPVMTSCTLADRAAVERAGMFRPLRRAQDLDLWARLLEQGPGVALARVGAVYHLRPAAPDRTSNDIDRSCVLKVLADNADKAWMTARVRDGCLGRMEWDDLRLAQREARWSDLVRHGLWFAAHPTAAPGVISMFANRRQARRVRATLALFTASA